MIKPEDTIEKYRRTDLTQENHEYLTKIKKLTTQSGEKQSVSKLVNNIIILGREKKLFNELTGLDLSNL